MADKPVDGKAPKNWKFVQRMRFPEEKPCMTVDVYTHDEQQKMAGRKVRFAKETQVKKDEDSEDDVWAEVKLNVGGVVKNVEEVMDYCWDVITHAAICR